MATKLKPVEAHNTLSGWRAFHIFYHADQNRLLRSLVAPVVRELLARCVIDRFFFVRYAFGGPHVRLRWRLTAHAAEGDAQSVLQNRAGEFFAEFPSAKPVSEEEVRRVNRLLAGSDSTLASEQDRVFADNTCERFPVGFETERYGGLRCFPASLELFSISSASVLRMLIDRGESSDEWVRAEALRSVAQFAGGFAMRNEQDFFSLAGYAARFLHPQFAPCASRAEEYFSRKRPELMELAGRALDNVPAGTLSVSAHELSGALSGLSAAARWYAAASHIHMHANRLGITNAGEAYLSHMLLLALEALRQDRPDQWRRWWDARPACTQRGSGASLSQTAGASLAALIEDQRQ